MLRKRTTVVQIEPGPERGVFHSSITTGDEGCPTTRSRTAQSAKEGARKAVEALKGTSEVEFPEQLRRLKGLKVGMFGS